MINLTPCNLSTLLTLAKEAHTRWEERFRMEAAPIPTHSWEDWYARFLIARLHEQELGATFDVGSCGIETVSENHVMEKPHSSQPADVESLCGWGPTTDDDLKSEMRQRGGGCSGRTCGARSPAHRLPHREPASGPSNSLLISMVIALAAILVGLYSI